MDPMPGHTFGGWVGQFPKFPQKPCEIVKIHIYTFIFHENRLILMEKLGKNMDFHDFRMFLKWLGN